MNASELSLVCATILSSTIVLPSEQPGSPSESNALFFLGWLQFRSVAGYATSVITAGKLHQQCITVISILVDHFENATVLLKVG